MPGHKDLYAWEASVAAGQSPIKIDLTVLILGTGPDAEATPEPEAGNAIDAESEAVPPPDGDEAETSG